jgi:hypothetical protein
VKGIKRERMKGIGTERESERKKIERKRRFLLQFLIKYPVICLSRNLRKFILTYSFMNRF